MMIARWAVEARFGQKSQAINLQQDVFDEIGSIRMHEDWGSRMSEVVVSGSSVGRVNRLID